MKFLGSGIGMDHSWSLILLSTAFLPVPGILCPLGSCLRVKDDRMGLSAWPRALGIHEPGERGEIFSFSPRCCVDVPVDDPVDVS